MAAHTLDELLRLPPDERAALAKALWDSLSEAERLRHLQVPPLHRAEAVGRSAEHAPLPWHQVRHVMQGDD